MGALIAVCSQKLHLPEGTRALLWRHWEVKSISTAASKATTKKSEGWGDISHIWLYLRCCFLGEGTSVNHCFSRPFWDSTSLLSPQALQSFLLRPQHQEQAPYLMAVLWNLHLYLALWSGRMLSDLWTYAGGDFCHFGYLIPNCALLYSSADGRKQSSPASVCSVSFVHSHPLPPPPVLSPNQLLPRWLCLWNRCVWKTKRIPFTPSVFCALGPGCEEVNFCLCSWQQSRSRCHVKSVRLKMTKQGQK